MNKQTVILLLIVTWTIIICSGCGARKVNKDKSKEETHIEQTDNSVTEKQIDINTKTTTTVNVDDKNETVTQETIYEPSDNTKESFVIEKDGTKVILNNVKKTVKKTTQKNNTQINKIGNSELVQNNASKEQKAIKEVVEFKKEIKHKDSEIKNTPWYYFAIGFVIVIGIIYFVLKKLRVI